MEKEDNEWRRKKTMSGEEATNGEGRQRMEKKG